MNLYLDIAKLKAQLNISDVAQDPQLLRLLERASRFADAYCNRHFYVKEDTWQLRVDRVTDVIAIPDLLSASSVKVNDVAKTAGTDYELEPLSTTNKLRIAALTANFAARDLLEIVGTWGYSNELELTGDTVQNDPLASSGDVIVSSGRNFAIGQTIKIEDEQCYIHGIFENTLNIKRGVNGTTAASHDNATVIYVYTYPALLVQACLIQTTRWYRGRDAAWGDEVGIDVKLKFDMEPHPSVRVLLNPFRRLVGGF